MFRIISSRTNAGINGTISDLADRADYYRRRCLDAEERIAEALELLAAIPLKTEHLPAVLTQTAFWEGLPRKAAVSADVDSPVTANGSDIV
ncbi:hypothetical protein ACWERV_23255 [Streptomyces sp. NPDC004031]